MGLILAARGQGGQTGGQGAYPFNGIYLSSQTLTALSWLPLAIRVATGQFAAQMDVALVNDGPVTLLLESW